MHGLSDPRWINVAALLLAAAALVVVFASAPDLFPPIPPGPLVLAAAAAIVALVPGRWTPLTGVLVPVFILTGGVITGGLEDTLDEGLTVLAGSIVQVAALVVAIISGSITTTREGRQRASP